MCSCRSVCALQYAAIGQFVHCSMQLWVSFCIALPHLLSSCSVAHKAAVCALQYAAIGQLVHCSMLLLVSWCIAVFCNWSVGALQYAVLLGNGLLTLKIPFTFTKLVFYNEIGFLIA